MVGDVNTSTDNASKDTIANCQLSNIVLMCFTFFCKINFIFETIIYLENAKSQITQISLFLLILSARKEEL